MVNKMFPNPDGKISALKHYLHILALVQYVPDNEETWNAESLARLLSMDEMKDSGSDENSITKYTNNQIKKGLGIDIDKYWHEGKRVWSVAEDIDANTQLEIARVYADFVIEDMSRDIALKRLIDAMPDRALWILARIYFAVIEKRMIQIDYTGSTGKERSNWLLCPCYIFLSEFRLYLSAYDPNEDLRFTLRLERINKLTVPENRNSKEWKISSVKELYKNSLSAFLSPEGPVTMKIRYKKNISSDIESLVNQLYTKSVSNVSDCWLEAEFVIDDYLYLCKQLFVYGNNVEIISPQKVREAMINMLREGMSVYE